MLCTEMDGDAPKISSIQFGWRCTEMGGDAPKNSSIQLGWRQAQIAAARNLDGGASRMGRGASTSHHLAIQMEMNPNWMEVHLNHWRIHFDGGASTMLFLTVCVSTRFLVSIWLSCCAMGEIFRNSVNGSLMVSVNRHLSCGRDLAMNGDFPFR